MTDSCRTDPQRQDKPKLVWDDEDTESKSFVPHESGASLLLSVWHARRWLWVCLKYEPGKPAGRAHTEVGSGATRSRNAAKCACEAAAQAYNDNRIETFVHIPGGR